MRTRTTTHDSTGHALMRSPLYPSSSACSVENFDLFLVASRPSSRYNEVLTVTASYGVVCTLALAIFVVVADRSLLPPRSDVLGGPTFSAAFSAAIVAACCRVVYELNAVSMLTMYSGLFSRMRAVPVGIWNARNGMTCQTLILDRLLRKVLRTQGEEAVVASLAQLRFKHEHALRSLSDSSFAPADEASPLACQSTFTRAPTGRLSRSSSSLTVRTAVEGACPYWKHMRAAMALL